MRTAKSRAIIRHISVLSLLILLALAAPRCWHWTKAESATTTEGLPSLRGEEAITHLKERGLYASLGEAVKAARYNAQPLPPDIVPLLAGSLQLKSGDGAAEDYFGAAVAISGNTAIVGAPRNDINGDADQGAAYIFVRSGRSWTQEDKLKAPTGAAGDFFGGSVAISGDTAIVGACFNDVGGNANQGSVYIFTRSAGVWTQQDKLTAGDGAANDLFGFSVAIDGDTAIIGAHLNDAGVNTNQGAAYVFTRSDGAWGQTQKLTASDAAAGDLFGFSVALDAETAVIGASGKLERGDADAGAAYVFTQSGGMWTEQQKLLPDISAVGNFFGAAVALSGDTALIGSFGDDIGANADQGSAVVFVRSGSTWTKQRKLTSTDGAAGDKFGLSVALYGDTAVIGAIGDDIGGADQGSSYVFSRTGVTWSQQPRLLDALGETDDKFGAPVAISGDTLLIGASFDDVGGNANQGSASVFVICNGLAEQQKLTAPNGGASDLFGYSVAISGDTAIVGAPDNDIGGNSNQGSANIFIRSGATWTHQQRLTAADGTASDNFGSSVAISGDTVVVGAIFDDPGGNSSQGSAYVFVRSGARWTQQQKLTSSDGAAGDHFSSVAISGDTAVVGAHSHDIGENPDQGAAYVFERSGATWIQQQRLTASDGASNFILFGCSVAISGDLVVVGADGLDESAYVFARSGETWTERQKLAASDNESVDNFGNSVGISGATVVVGADGDDNGANARLGSAYVFACAACPEITLDPVTLPNGTAGNPYNWSITASGGVEPYNYSVSSGTLPVGLTLDSTTGALSGTPAMAGTFNFTMTATGSGLCPGSRDYALVIACRTINVTPANPNLPPGSAGAAYNRTFTANGGLAPYGFSISAGALPAGLTLDAATGVLSGAPTVTGVFSFEVRVTDGYGCSGSWAYVLTINCPQISIHPTRLEFPNIVFGTPFNQTFSAAGGVGTYTFAIEAGALPSGLRLDASTGALSGTPTVRDTFNFIIRATDGNGCIGRRPYQVVVN